MSREIVRMRYPSIVRCEYVLDKIRLTVSFVVVLFMIASFPFTGMCAEDLFLRNKKVTEGEVTIVLDPGHGGYDAGAGGPGGLKEKEVSLSLARAIKKRLPDHYTVVLTRTDDYLVDIEERTAIANHHNADLFVSIHVGGSFRHRASGLGTFYWSGEKSRGAGYAGIATEAWDTEAESPDWERIQQGYLLKSRTLATHVHKELIERLNIHDRGCKGAPVYALAGANMPAILVEIGYITNPVEEKNLDNPSFLELIARGVSKGIIDFLQAQSDSSWKQ